MKQVVQEVRSGRTLVSEVPAPIAQPGHVVVQVMASLVSAGTERYVVELAQKSLLGKARARPDHVRRVLQKVRQEGLLTTVGQVRAKLDEPMPLGYSAAGVVLECGRGVDEFKPGDRVAVAAPHAGVISVGRRLCARIPDGVSFEDAAYTSVGAIALEGVRLARLGLGDRVLVIGLGLVGQITVGLLAAQGCRVFGTDLDAAKLELAKELGADAVALGSPRQELEAFSEGHGVDAVLITAATASNEPIELAADVARTRGRIVLVGVAGLELPRPPFYAKELEFTVSSSLGPGRGDERYEERGIDYPIGFARWTAQRNMGAVLDTMAAGRLPVGKLTSHRFKIDEATRAYELITSGETPYCGIVLSYPDEPIVKPRRRLQLQARIERGSVRASIVGTGNFARLIMLPILRKQQGIEWRGICGARGLHAGHSGEASGFSYATTDFEEILADDATDAVFLFTRHNLHSDMVLQALRRGKHVFVEKPLAITMAELHEIEACVDELGDECPLLMVGFNRRFAPALTSLRDAFATRAPLSVQYRFATGAVPASSWIHDPEVGGTRLASEACHAIDACTAIIGSPPVRVYAESVDPGGSGTPSDDRSLITLRHENGSISSVSYQAGGSRAAPKERIEVFGGGRTGVVDDWNGVDLWDGGQSKLRTGRSKGHVEEIEAFFKAVRRGGAWPIPWPELHASSWASLAALESLATGMPVSKP